MTKIIKLYMENETEGFCIDKTFVKTIHDHLKKTKKKDRTEELLCATIIAEFLAHYEVRAEVENVVN